MKGKIFDRRVMRRFTAASSPRPHRAKWTRRNILAHREAKRNTEAKHYLVALQSQYALSPTHQKTSANWGNIAFIIMRQSQLFRFAVCHSTTLDGTSSGDLAKKYYPETGLKGDWSGNRAFWTSDRAEKVLGWTHHEKE
ncbi:hypothetical protein DFH09DRAFT_1069335 [Mycena vulgaris]|nr:hypothetical protein DFH09DRAFT_1069335 [Mycena vulgaris]